MATGPHRPTSKLIGPAAALVPVLALLYLKRDVLHQVANIRKGKKGAGGRKRALSTGMPLTTPQLEIAQRDLYKNQPDGTRSLLVVDSRSRLSTVKIRETPASTFAAHAPLFRRPPPPTSSTTTTTSSTTGPSSTEQKTKRVGVNAQFFHELKAIFAIIIPRATSKEVWLFALHTGFLLMRTYLSLLVAKLDGRIVRDLVSANARGFGMGLVLWYLLAIPSTYTNSMIRYLQSKLALSFRTRLTRYVHDLYLSDKNNYYKIINLDGTIDSADQYITTDISRFCDTLASLYSNVSKPTLDLLLFNYQLGRSIGRLGSFGLFISYLFTAWILRQVTPAFGKLAAVEAKLEGDFRNAHTRLITNAEEIAFYNGQGLERGILDRAYLRLIRHVNSIFKIRIAYSMTEDFVIKYLWSAAGYCLISIPVFFGPQVKQAAAAVGAATEVGLAAATATAVKQDGVGGDAPDVRPEVDSELGRHVAKRTENYISNRRLLLSLADAGGRLMYSYKDLAELAGYTSRVYSLLSTLHELNSSKYQTVPRPASLPPSAPFYDLGHINGSLVDAPPHKAGVEVRVEKVPIVAPAPGLARGGELLVKDLDLVVKQGEHVLITGANGTGKTAIARVLAGLWPAFEGRVARPDKEEIVFLPQRPYLSLGSLRDQVIYPHSYVDYKATGKTDEDLLKILEYVHLAYLPSREGGFDTRKEWKDVLSGGEKQRMGMARLFYHQPKFGVLDECTSAVSTDVEGLMYAKAKEFGITLITISHRPSLFKYHLHLLRLTSEHNQWELSTIGTAQEQLSFDKEVAALEAKLRDVEGWKQRLGEIEKELNFTKA